MLCCHDINEVPINQCPCFRNIKPVNRCLQSLRDPAVCLYRMHGGGLHLALGYKVQYSVSNFDVPFWDILLGLEVSNNPIRSDNIQCQQSVM